MTSVSYKVAKETFSGLMESAYAQPMGGAYYILHATANLLEHTALNADRDRNGFKITPARRKEMLDEVNAIRNLARSLKN